MTVRDDEFWAGFIGVEPGEWSEAGVTVCSHVGLSGYLGFWCFRRNRKVVVSAPPSWVRRLEEMVAGHAGDELMEPGFWSQALGRDFERAIGPAFQGCLAPAKFVPRASDAVGPVTEADQAAVERFRAACGEEWNMPDEARLWRHACFDAEGITALAGYRSWNDDAGDPCVITRPDARSGGRGAAVTSAVVAEALAAGKLLLYQTLESNEAAVRVALSLGYERYANHLAVRLRSDSPS